MVTISSLFVSIRAKLGDNDAKNYRYSEAEIIDTINDALAVLSEELLCFSRIWYIECKECVSHYALPLDFLKPLSFKLNNALISDVQSMESRIETESFTHGVSYDMQSFHIFSNRDLKSSDKVELYYNYFETINHIGESINLPNTAKEVIVYYVLHLLYQNPIKKDGMSRSVSYLNLYEKKLESLRSRVKMNAQSKNIRTTYVKV